NLDRFDQEADVFFNKIRQAYLKRAALQPEKYHKIDASQSIKTVQQNIWNIIHSVISTIN
ncbi:MAG: dTMP kinase, partial [Pseudomonadota bacterium]